MEIKCLKVKWNISGSIGMFTQWEELPRCCQCGGSRGRSFSCRTPATGEKFPIQCLKSYAVMWRNTATQLKTTDEEKGMLLKTYTHFKYFIQHIRFLSSVKYEARNITESDLTSCYLSALSA